MFGLFFAALCAAGLYRLWRPRRFGPYAYAGCGGWRHGSHGRPGLGRLIRKLNANPDQESAIRESAEEIRGAMKSFDPSARLQTLSAALTAESLDREQLRSQLREPESGSLLDALLNSVERLRSKLDLEQRTKLAAMLTGGGRCR